MKAEYHPERIKLELELWEAAFLLILLANTSATQFTNEFIAGLYHRLNEILEQDPLLFDNRVPNSFICQGGTHLVQIGNGLINIQEE